MRTFRIIFIVFAFLMTQQTFAEMTAMTTEPASSDCEMIAKACLDAGYSEKGKDGKAFWYDCMKPILLGKAVDGVNIDQKNVVACRQFKIMDLQNLLKELQQGS